jgi:hypothetical protein
MYLEMEAAGIAARAEQLGVDLKVLVSDNEPVLDEVEGQGGQ